LLSGDPDNLQTRFAVDKIDRTSSVYTDDGIGYRGMVQQENILGFISESIFTASLVNLVIILTTVWYVVA
jgi:hypothetical protein